MADSKTASQPVLVDVHTHMYPPAYIELLKSRDTVPYIYSPEAQDPRLIILPSDDDSTVPIDQRGRPVDASYSSVAEKLKFMDKHGIAASVISLANPWLDWVPANSAAETARRINDDAEALCEQHPGRLYHFGTLPLSAATDDIAAEVARLKDMKRCKGIVMGTTGLGKGLDDPAMSEIWGAIEKAGSLVFLHPHYGLPSEVFGPLQGQSGHVMPLALGFPLETTIAFVRMYLAGVFDRRPRLKMLLAHAGGTVPFLAGRLHSCMLHERKLLDEEGSMVKMRDIWEGLKTNIWLDGVVYSDIGVTAATGAVGSDRIMWGTDHPFFPPVGRAVFEQEKWASVMTNVEAVHEAFHDNPGAVRAVLGENAIRLLGLDISEKT